MNNKSLHFCRSYDDNRLHVMQDHADAAGFTTSRPLPIDVPACFTGTIVRGSSST